MDGFWKLTTYFNVQWYSKTLKKKNNKKRKHLT